MSYQEQPSVAVKALRTENTVLQRDNEALRRENQVLQRRIESLHKQTREMSGQTLLQQIENQKKENRQDREAITQQMEALKDQIQLLNTKLQDENALNNKFKEEKEAMRQQISSHQQQNHELKKTVEALEVFEQKYHEIKGENKAVRQQTEALRQNIQVLNTKLQDGHALNDKFEEEKEAMRQQISFHQKRNHELKETVEALKVFEQKCNEIKEENEVVRQQTEALRQNIQELQSEQNLYVQEQLRAAEMEARLGQQEELKRQGEVISLEKTVSIKDEQLRALVEEFNTEKEAMSQKINTLQLEIQELRKNNIKQLKEEEALRAQEQVKRKVCGKLIHSKQRHESEADILKKVQHWQNMCSTEKKHKDALKLENDALCQEKKKQEELMLKVMDGFEETNELKKSLHEVAVQEYATELKTLTENYNAVKDEMEAIRQSYDVLERENQELKENHLKKLKEEEALRVQEQVKREECRKLIHSKQQRHESEVEIPKCKVQHLQNICSTAKKHKDALKLENEALRQEMKKQEELMLKVMDGFEETNELKKSLHEVAAQEHATELKTLTENYNAVKDEMEATRQSYDALHRENRELRETRLKQLKGEEALRVQEQVKREECDKFIHSKQQQHESEAEILKCKVQHWQNICSTEKKEKDALKQENDALRQEMKKQEEVSLKLMDGYEETIELKKSLHEVAVQDFATELKTLTENCNVVRDEMEAMRPSHDALQRENQELRENLREEKSLLVQEQLKTSEMEQKRLLHKELVQKLRGELDKMIHLKQSLHDGESELLNCQPDTTEEKCETVRVQKEVVSQENAALLRQILELSRKLQVEKSSFIQQQLLTAQSEEELCDQVDVLQVLLQLKTKENEDLQSEIQSLKLKMNPPDSQPQEGRTFPYICGWLSQLVKQEKQREDHKTPPIFYLENNDYTQIDTTAAGWFSS